MIDRLLAHLKSEEGFRPYVYDDANGEPIVPGYTVIGHPTMWHGFCVEKGRVPALPPSIPEEVLARVAESKWLALRDRMPWVDELPESVQVGLASMAYQLGANGVMRFKNMIQALAVGDFHGAAAHALDSAWAKQTPHRARRVAELIRGS